MVRRSRGVRAHLSREQVAAVACRLMARVGFFDVSFQRIADELGVSQSTVMHYFPDRERLVRAVLEHVIRANHEFVSRRIQGADPALRRLWMHFHGNLEWARRRPEEASVILLLYYMGSVREELAALYREILRRARERILEHVLAAKREAAIAPRMRPELAAELLHDGLLASLLNLVATRDKSVSRKALETKWRSLAAAVLRPTRLTDLSGN